ncbi:MAG: serine/threonine-protein kinase PknK [Myxococcota bacterium]
MQVSYKTAKAEELLSDRFEILERLGSGGFGVVYKARDRELGSLVALKTLHETNPKNLFRFKREFRALADLTHPNLVTLYELISEGQLWYFTMELVDGEDFLSWMHDFIRQDSVEDAELAEPSGDADTLEADTLDIVGEHARDTADTIDESGPSTGEMLAKNIENGRPLDMARLRRVLAQLVRGTRALHRTGKLHRDIKPFNVLVTEDDHVQLLDFGMVADLTPHPSLRQSDREEESAGFVGTPRYMSPEQAMGQKATEATDWYSVGVMLYEALTGQPPLEGETTLQLLLRKQTTDPPQIDELAPGLPEDLTSLCMDMLQRAPEDRPTGEQILKRLGENPYRRDTSSLLSVSGGWRPANRLVGRTEELSQLALAYETVTEAKCGVIANISGESGLGKTALVRHFLDKILQEHDRAVVLEGRCYENESVPYKAMDSLVDDLSTYMEALPRDEVSSWLTGCNVEALTRIFPVLERVDAVSEAVARELTDGDSQQIRRKAFRSLRHLLDKLASTRPVICFVDDVQWGDEDSALMIRELLDGAAPPLLFMTTFRREDVDSSPFLERYLEFQSGAEIDIVDIALGELQEADSKEMVTSLLEDAAPSEDVLDAIAREARGNPLFLDELARHAAEGASKAGPSSLGEIIERRVSRLDDEARRLLEVLAVAAQPLDRDLIREVARLDEREPAVLATLRRNRLIRVKSGRDGDQLESYHDRIRETVRDSISPQQSRLTHLSLAENMEERGGYDMESLSRHFEHAGDAKRAGHYALVAADRAADALAFERAANLYERALDLRRWESKRRRIQERLGEMYGYVGRGELAARAYLRATEDADEMTGEEYRLDASEQFLRAGYQERGQQLLESVLGNAGFSVPSNKLVLIASILWNRAKLTRRGYECDLRDVDEIPRAEAILTDALWTGAKMYGTSDLLLGAYFHFHAILSALETGHPDYVALTLCQQAAQEASRRESRAAAQQLLDRAEEISRSAEQPNYVLGYVEFMRGMTRYLGGQWRRAYEGMSDGTRTLSTHCDGVTWEVTTCSFFEHFALYMLGELHSFRDRLPDMLDDARERGDVYHVVGIESWMYISHLCNDRPDLAVDALEDARSHWAFDAIQLQHFWYISGRVEVALYEGEIEEGWEVLQDFWGRLSRSFLFQNQLIRILSHFLRARAALAQSARASSWWKRWWFRRTVRSSIKSIERERMAWGEPLAQLARAQLAQLDGEHSRAIDLLDEASENAQEQDMALHQLAGLRRQGELLGGDRGAEMIELAETELRERGVDNPTRMCAMITASGPGRTRALPE